MSGNGGAGEGVRCGVSSFNGEGGVGVSVRASPCLHRAAAAAAAPVSGAQFSRTKHKENIQPRSMRLFLALQEETQAHHHTAFCLLKRMCTPPPLSSPHPHTSPRLRPKAASHAKYFLMIHNIYLIKTRLYEAQLRPSAPAS